MSKTEKDANKPQPMPGTHSDGKKTTGGIVNDAPAGLNAFQYPKGGKK